jgi:hypothetical protein
VEPGAVSSETVSGDPRFSLSTDQDGGAAAEVAESDEAVVVDRRGSVGDADVEAEAFIVLNCKARKEGVVGAENPRPVRVLGVIEMKNGRIASRTLDVDARFHREGGRLLLRCASEVVLAPGNQNRIAGLRDRKSLSDCFARGGLGPAIGAVDTGDAVDEERRRRKGGEAYRRHLNREGGRDTGDQVGARLAAEEDGPFAVERFNGKEAGGARGNFQGDRHLLARDHADGGGGEDSPPDVGHAQSHLRHAGRRGGERGFV